MVITAQLGSPNAASSWRSLKLLGVSCLILGFGQVDGSWTGAASELFKRAVPILGEAVANSLLKKVDSGTQLFKNSKVHDKTVMLTFSIDGDVVNNGASKLWNPRKTDLASVINDVGIDIEDVALSAKIRDGKEDWVISLSSDEDLEMLLQHSSEQKFLKVNVALRQPPQSKPTKPMQATTTTAKGMLAKVSDTVGAIAGWIYKTKKEIVGKAPTKEHVEAKEKEMLKFVDHTEKTAVALEDEEYDVEKWPEAVAALKESLTLSDADAKQLGLAAFKRTGRKSVFNQRREGDTIKTTFTSYRTIKEDNKISLVYGHYEHSATRKPVDDHSNVIKMNGRLFKVLPEASPHTMQRGVDMIGVEFTLSPGMRLVTVDDKDFNNIREKVIKPFGWNTDCLLVQGAVTSGWSWPCYNTAYHATHQRQSGALPGELWHTFADPEFAQAGAGYRIHIDSIRLLVELPTPEASNAELAMQLQACVEPLARHEWAKKLAIEDSAGSNDDEL